MDDKSAIWTEKYRPSKFSEVRGQKDIVLRLQAFVSQKNMPHVLFAGPPGVGKTTLSLVMVKELFQDGWRENFLELNASDERGIDVIRVKVKDFARTRAIGNVPFKIIYLDECDALTKEAQQALRRTMENYTKTCRFILSCNYSSKIIDPIQSRCAVFRFKPLDQEDILEIIKTISEKEGLTVTESAKKALIEVSDGDCRKVENVLQSCSSLQKNIDENLIYSIAAMARPKEVKEVLILCVKNNFPEAKKRLLSTMLDYGLSGLDIIKQVQKNIWDLDIDAKKRLEMIKMCGDSEFRMVEGSDEFIQLEAMISAFCLINS
jgi:replication factor C small subunit